jgi:hypothetical protein
MQRFYGVLLPPLGTGREPAAFENQIIPRRKTGVCLTDSLAALKIKAYRFSAGI